VALVLIRKTLIDKTIFFCIDIMLAHVIILKAWRNWKDGTPSNIIDPTLRASSTYEIMRCIHIGLLCVQENVADRPTMASVTLMLNNHITLSMPSQPAFFMHTTVESNISPDIFFKAATNETSINELYPR
jgi:hypothetical protein